MSAVSFESWGGSTAIGANCHTLKFGDFRVGVDFGAAVKGEQRAPIMNGKLDALFVTHAHMDHHGMVPCALEEWPGLPLWATFETKKLIEWAWADQLRICDTDGKEAPFTAAQARHALRQMRKMTVGVPIQLTDGLTVTPYHAGHILGAVSLLFTYHGEHVFVTGDISLRDHSFVPRAVPPQLDHCKLLVRESTYVGECWKQDRPSIEDDLVGAVTDVLCGGGRVVIPTLAIDRLANVYQAIHRARLDRDWPVWVSGGVDPTNIYRAFAPGAQTLAGIRRFANSYSERAVMYSDQPVIVIASSGMVMPGSPSYRWAMDVLGDPKSAIFLVNWQDPATPGGAILRSEPGERIEISPGIFRKRQCRVERFDLSAHAKEDEMQELEEMLHPELVVHVHGEGERIKSFIDAQASGPQRVCPSVGQEVVL